MSMWCIKFIVGALGCIINMSVINFGGYQNSLRRKFDTSSNSKNLLKFFNSKQPTFKLDIKFTDTATWSKKFKKDSSNWLFW